jgi:hypothetical protein
VSSAGYAAEQDAVVWVRRSAWERVTEREELVGKLRAGSRLPQYLCGGRLAAGLEVKRESGVEWGVLDNGNVYRRSGAGSVDFLVCHSERSEYQVAIFKLASVFLVLLAFEGWRCFLRGWKMREAGIISTRPNST